MMDDYNATQGQTDKNVVSVETVPDVEMLTKMTASVWAATRRTCGT